MFQNIEIVSNIYMQKISSFIRSLVGRKKIVGPAIHRVLKDKEFETNMATKESKLGLPSKMPSVNFSVVTRILTIN